jgi:hypothetical protein
VSRTKAVLLCAVLLLAGFIAGRVTGGGSTASTVTVEQTVERSIVVGAQHLGSAADPRDAGPLDLARVSSVRRGSILQTTIVARRPWSDALLRTRRVRLSLSYDIDDNGNADLHDDVLVLNGRLTSWISSLGQGVAGAVVTRRSPTTITVARDASVFYAAPGTAGMLTTSPIGVAVTARWRGGGDRVPNRGWITVPPPTADAAPAAPTTTLSAPAASPTTTAAPATCADVKAALAKIDRDLAAIRRAAKLPTKSMLDGNHATNVAIDRFLDDISLAPISNLQRNRLIDRAAAAVTGVCEQCFQALEANRPIPAIRMGDLKCGKEK